MDTTGTDIFAFWSVLLVGFAGIAVFLARQGELAVTVVGIYWFPSVVLTLIGVFPPPWAAFAGLS